MSRTNPTYLLLCDAGRESPATQQANFTLFHVLAFENHLSKEPTIYQEIEASAGIRAQIKLMHATSRASPMMSVTLHAYKYVRRLTTEGPSPLLDCSS